MRINEAFRLDDVQAARTIAQAHPFATIVGSGLRATHMPLLVEAGTDGLVLLGHIAEAERSLAAAMRRLADA